MASKSAKSSAGTKQLKATIKRLRSDLERSEAKAARWKRRSSRSQESETQARKELKKLSKRHARLGAPQQPIATSGAPAAVAADALPATPTSAEPDPHGSAEPEVATPDEGWTVVQLRAEARARGLGGYSGKSKAELIDALS